MSGLSRDLGPVPLPASFLVALREYAAVEHRDAPEGSDARVVWSGFYALTTWVLEMGDEE